ncbi:MULTISPECIES: TetR/AcrR family transcriptional regulator [Sporosarcina]|uniref:TetR/AcrR family transcriptional regulator n=1 Tax=Sporosarcina contaminans TaxID=633403 RepID=A0ABW3U4U3_9BACL
MKKTDGRLQRTLKTREKLLKAASKVFLKKGYHNSTIKEINQEANVGHGTFYIHFPKGKDEILSELMKNVMDELYKVADIEFDPKTKEDAFHVIREQVFHFISLAEVHRSILMVVYEAIGVSQLLSDKWEEILLKFAERIVKDNQYSQGHGLAKKDLNTGVSSRVLLFTCERFVWEIVREKNKIPIPEIADNITKIYMFGLYEN